MTTTDQQYHCPRCLGDGELGDPLGRVCSRCVLELHGAPADEYRVGSMVIERRSRSGYEQIAMCITPEWAAHVVAALRGELVR